MGWTRGGLRAATAAACLLLVGAAARSGGLHPLHGDGRIPPPRHRPALAVPLVEPQHAPPPGHGGHVPAAVWISLASVGALAVLVLLVLVVRAIARTGWRPRLPSFAVGPAAAEPADAATPDAELVTRGADAALAALDEGVDPRSAVIAAYAGMVAALDRAGTPGAAVLTPGRLLLRAAAAGLVDGGDARALTSLFERARFSTQEITAADVADARSRLDAVRGRLALAAPA